MKVQIALPAIVTLVLRAWDKNSLTLAGLVVATLTAIAHAYHPWNLPFVLLVVFFIAGTRVTHIKEDVKTRLTLSSGGKSGGEGPRSHVQVLANSLMASICSIMHARQLEARKARLIADPTSGTPTESLCLSWGGDLLVVGIIANYAAVAADTFSSELGILSNQLPRLITSPTLRKVPKGTNGGVTLWGLGAGLLGSMLMVTASMLFLPTCSDQTASMVGGGVAWTLGGRRTFMSAMVIWGGLGSVLDSVLGGLLQRSVRDVRSGKIVEGEGGVRVLVSSSTATRLQSSGDKASLTSRGGKLLSSDDTAAKPDDTSKSSEVGSREPTSSRMIENGLDLLDNNGVNFLMATTMTIGSMAIAGWYWDVPLSTVFQT